MSNRLDLLVERAVVEDVDLDPLLVRLVALERPAAAGADVPHVHLRPALAGLALLVARQRRLVRLPRLDPPPRELPQERQDRRRVALGDEVPAVVGCG